MPALKPVRLAGCGSATPEHSLSNDDLSKLVETDHDWIVTRTGISNRHILTNDESMTSLATRAAAAALEMAGIAAGDVDAVILCTSTPEDMFGGAGAVQAALGADGAVAFDLTAACSGFVLGLVTATNYIRAGPFRTCVVIGADALSRAVDWTDRRTCILFGDGCGAVVVTAADEGAEECALLGYDMHSNGHGQKHLHCMYETGKVDLAEGVHAHAGGSYAPLAMNGQEVFKFAVRAVPSAVKAALEMAGKGIDDVDWLVLHQANQRILSAAASRLGVPEEKVVSNVGEYGNTSAASIPIALDEAVRAGKIAKGDLIATAGFGAGLTWAGAVVRWG